MFSNLKISRFKFNLQVLDKILLPEFKGFAFRGGFGHAFKRVVCTFKDKIDCVDCLLKEKCLYSYIFETITESDIELLKKTPKFPHPFIIEAENNNKTLYKSEEKIGFDLILIGKAIEYLPYFVYSFKLLGSYGVGKGRGKYLLKKVFSTDNTGKTNMIFDGEQQVLNNKYYILSAEELIQNNKQTEKTVSLKFVTPTRIRFDRKLIDNLEFHVLIRNLIRRLSLIIYRHCDDELKIDYKNLIEESKGVEISESDLKWHDLERYSSRQTSRMKMGGFIGKITYKGNITPYIPLIKIGEHLHVGKGVSFGLGKYEIVT